MYENVAIVIICLIHMSVCDEGGNPNPPLPFVVFCVEQNVEEWGGFSRRDLPGTVLRYANVEQASRLLKRAGRSFYFIPNGLF